MTPEDAVLYLERDMEEVETCAFYGGTAAVFSARCPGKEGPNEDAAALIPFDEDGGTLLVADGAGGQRAKDFVRGDAQVAVRALRDRVARRVFFLDAVDLEHGGRGAAEETQPRHGDAVVGADHLAVRLADHQCGPVANTDFRPRLAIDGQIGRAHV